MATRSNTADHDTGIAPPLSKRSSSPSSCSFYSSCSVLGEEEGSQADSLSCYSYYSTGTVRDTDTDTASYCSIDTLVGDSEDDEEGRERVDVTKQFEGRSIESELQEVGYQMQQNVAFEDTDTVVAENVAVPNPETPVVVSDQGNIQDEEEPGASRCVSAITGSVSCVESDEDISIAGRVNEGIGRLLGYTEENHHDEHYDQLQEAAAQILGYEIVGTERDRFTVSFYIMSSFFY